MIISPAACTPVSRYASCSRSGPPPSTAWPRKESSPASRSKARPSSMPTTSTRPSPVRKFFVISTLNRSRHGNRLYLSHFRRHRILREFHGGGYAHHQAGQQRSAGCRPPPQSRRTLPLALVRRRSRLPLCRFQPWQVHLRRPDRENIAAERRVLYMDCELSEK